MDKLFSEYEGVALEHLKLQIVRHPDTENERTESAFLMDFLARDKCAAAARMAEASDQAA